MRKKSLFTFLAIYLFLYSINYLAPMAFGDDYLYSFIWQGNPMFTPLTEEAVRVLSWHDLFVSQWSHYFTWSGRTVNHILSQYFLWKGKNVFNFFNAFIAIILIMEIYWCIDNGCVSFDFNPKAIWWIFFALWAFTPGFSPTFLWLNGACNYLWTNTIILGFLIPYVHKYYYPSEKKDVSIFFNIFFIIWGILAGWTNENSVCWIILFLMLFIYRKRKDNEIEKWMYFGVIGLIIGYSLLMLAPGNMVRFHAEHGADWFNQKLLKENLNMFLMVIFFHCFLWYFNIRSIISLNHMKLEEKEIRGKALISKICCLLAFCMSGIMVVSPFFPPRSAFAGTIYLIIAVGTLLHLQDKYDILLIRKNALKFLTVVGILYFVMTSVVTLFKTYDIKLQMDTLLTSAKHMQSINDKKTILTVKPFKETSRTEAVLSGFHIPGFELSNDENYWTNVAFARYYGIKGIRMLKEDKEGTESEDK